MRSNKVVFRDIHLGAMLFIIYFDRMATDYNNNELPGNFRRSTETIHFESFGSERTWIGHLWFETRTQNKLKPRFNHTDLQCYRKTNIDRQLYADDVAIKIH